MDVRDRMILSEINDRKITKEKYSDIFNRLFDIELSEDEARKELRGIEVMLNYKLEQDCSTLEEENKSRLVISDIHLPFAVDGWLEFIINTHKKYNCHDEIIINGDLIDFHAISFHQTETDAMTHIDEHEKAKKMVKQLASAFPKVIWNVGNHDDRISRAVKTLGIDKRFVRTLPEIFDLPETWIVKTDDTIDNVFYRHVGCSGGVTGARNSAINNRMSTVVSHLHQYGGVHYIANPNGEMIFGLNTGCLMDDEGYHARYGQLNKTKGTLGCGIVINDKEAHFIPFKKQE